MGEKENILPNASYPELYKQALLAYGVDAEIDIAIEEMSELTKALLKNRRATEHMAMSCNSYLDSEQTKQAVYEEIADVIIVLTELVMIFGGEDEIRKNITDKITRLKKGLESTALQSVHIADLNLSARIYNALSRAGIYNLDDLSKCNLKNVRNIGAKGISEIKDSLAKYTNENGGP